MKKLPVLLAVLCVILAVTIVSVVVVNKNRMKPSAEPAEETAVQSVSDEASVSVGGSSAETVAITDAETTDAESSAPQTTASAAQDTTAPQNDAWKQAYRNYLKSYSTEDHIQSKFALIYIDADDIPELAVCDGSFHAAWWKVLTYRGSAVKDIGEFGGWGTMFYYEKAAMIFSSYGNHGAWTANLYKIENGEAVSVWEASGDLDEDGEEIFFDADGNPITEAEYNAQMEAAEPADAEQCSRSISYDEDGWELTNANIEQYLR